MGYKICTGFKEKNKTTLTLFPFSQICENGYMNIQRIAKDPRLCKALTGLSHQEFSDLVPVFEKALCELRMRKPKRKRKAGGGRPGKLPTIESKLFFILFRVPEDLPDIRRTGIPDRPGTEPLLRIGATPSEKSSRKHWDANSFSPNGKSAPSMSFSGNSPKAKDIFLDGAERRIQRPKDSRRRRKTYSGKKKANTRKNIVMSDEKKKMLSLSPAKSGRRHDKRIADKASLLQHVPPEAGVWADSGFQGVRHRHPNTLVPKRGSKNHPLTNDEKEENRIISSFRIVVEHAIGGAKRYRALSDAFRNKLGWLDDLFMELGAGLWNFHLRYAV